MFGDCLGFYFLTTHSLEIRFFSHGEAYSYVSQEALSIFYILWGNHRGLSRSKVAEIFLTALMTRTELIKERDMAFCCNYLVEAQSRSRY